MDNGNVWRICEHCQGEGKVEVFLSQEEWEEHCSAYDSDEIPEPITKNCHPCTGSGKIRYTAHVEYDEDSDEVCGCEACRYDRARERRADAHLAWREDGCRGPFDDYYIESWDYRDEADIPRKRKSNKWTHGCGKSIEVFVPHGYTYRGVMRECGSTAHDGGINQCDKCESKHPYSMPHEDESDLDWNERQHGDDY